MPSAALQHWQTDRLPRLRHLDAQCRASPGLAPPNPALADENLRGYVVLLSAHFQGFCRDLYSEAAQVVVSKVRVSLQILIQSQFTTHCGLGHGNPNIDTIARDFNRFGLDLKKELATAPNTPLRLQHLAAMNRWRNVAAHQGVAVPDPLTLAGLHDWQMSCDELAMAFDDIVYNRLRTILRRKPW